MDGKLFLTAAALLLVAACTKEDPGAAFRSDPDAVRITAQEDASEGEDVEIQLGPDLQNKKIVGVVGSIIRV